MVLILSTQRWFQPASNETPNTEEWHAFRENAPDALCGTTRISYNRDNSGDRVPADGKVHAACQTAVDKAAEDEAKAVADENAALAGEKPVKKPKKK